MRFKIDGEENMSESSGPVINSCLTVAVAIILILCLLTIIGAGILVFGLSTGL